METWLMHAGKFILLTMADCYVESRAAERDWDRADVIIRVDDRGAKILRGETD